MPLLPPPVWKTFLNMRSLFTFTDLINFKRQRLTTLFHCEGVGLHQIIGESLYNPFCWLPGSGDNDVVKVMG